MAENDELRKVSDLVDELDLTWSGLFRWFVYSRTDPAGPGDSASWSDLRRFSSEYEERVDSRAFMMVPHTQWGDYSGDMSDRANFSNRPQRGFLR